MFVPYPEANGFVVAEDTTLYRKNADMITDLQFDIGKGFFTNGGSYINMLVPLIGSRQSGNAIEAFMLHDALYSKASFVKKEIADEILKDDLLEAGRPWHQVHLIMFGLWVGGWAHYQKDYPQFLVDGELRYAKPDLTGTIRHLGEMYKII